MTQDEKRTGQTPHDETRGEVVISGLDTGPGPAERENTSPTDELARLTPTRPHPEPTDEDG
ncbi:hypothetical protein Dcar01_02529 [Deinococcus carri]|uniref:Uncharacterized protein n=1 Tax=Deinococcus carri TaxID=1211323 RepID=A0ABP9W8V7_9DEIO